MLQDFNKHIRKPSRLAAAAGQQHAGQLCARLSWLDRCIAASPFSQPQLACRSKVPAEHVWSACLCRGCASNLEVTVRWTAKPRSPQCHLPTQLKDVSVSTIPGALSALEVLCDYALYKSTFTLHIITWTHNKLKSAQRDTNLRAGTLQRDRTF